MSEMDQNEPQLSINNFGMVLLDLWIISWIVTAGLGIYIYLNDGLHMLWGYDGNHLLAILVSWSLVYTIILILVVIYDYKKECNNAEEYTTHDTETTDEGTNNGTKRKCLIFAPLIAFVVVCACVVYASWQGKLVSQTTEQVKIFSLLPYSNTITGKREYLVNNIKSHESITLEVPQNIASYLSNGDTIDVNRKVYSKFNTTSSYYSVVELDDQGRPIYDITNAKKHDIIPLKATIINKKQVCHYSSDAHGISHSYYTGAITFKYKDTDKVETREVSESDYASYHEGQQIRVLEHTYTLKNGIKVTNYEY